MFVQFRITVKDQKKSLDPRSLWSFSTTTKPRRATIGFRKFASNRSSASRGTLDRP